MAFENLQDKLSSVFKKLRGRGRLTENDIKSAMREVRLALLEADVSVKVVRDFIDAVSARALGSDVLESLTPGQQVIKIVNEELTALMGGSNERINMAPKPPTVVMMVGLQGAGKTTNGAKLAGYFKSQLSKRPLMVACDVYRPAAIKQLQIVAEQVGVPVFEMGQSDPVEIAKKGIAHAREHGNDMVFLDTAGRLHIDESMMDELKRIKAAVTPDEIMLVVDAMTGQDAVNAATAFNNALDIDSIYLAKLDSDARGGAALSVKAATGKPIKFVGIGEKLDASNIEPFYPDRMASRILGMGDMLSLIEKAQQAFDEKKAEELERKMRQNRMTLDDFLDQMRQIKKMGSMQNILKMIPGINAKQLEGTKIDEKQISRTEAIILSMTKQERDNPSILNSSRKKRIAAGSGTRVEDVNRLLKQFEATQAMAKKLTGGKPVKNFGGPMAKNRKGFKYPF
ncbi:MAG: signal recognition particle protein [Clostridiales bacterium]|nr:signal recognition particle protein [Clostridiales bacterium]MDD7308975.1 signal recognition particle protein [Eubacteriales bacterium]